MITGKPLFTVNQIQSKVKEIAARISDDYRGKDLLVVCILKGAFMFTADLVRAIEQPLSLDFIIASSYQKADTTGEVVVHCDIREDVSGRDVILVEDIVDTGLTLARIRDSILKKGPASLRICGLLDKQERRKVDVKIDYVGFEIPNVFVVGYGLDYENRFRNLPYVSVFKQSTGEMLNV